MSPVRFARILVLQVAPQLVEQPYHLLPGSRGPLHLTALLLTDKVVKEEEHVNQNGST